MTRRGGAPEIVLTVGSRYAARIRDGRSERAETVEVLGALGTQQGVYGHAHLIGYHARTETWDRAEWERERDVIHQPILVRIVTPGHPGDLLLLHPREIGAEVDADPASA